MSLIHSDFKHMTLDDLLTLNAIPSETQYDHIVTEYNHKYNELKTKIAEMHNPSK